MFGLKTEELILVVVIILFFFGGKKIPEFSKGVATSIKEFRKGLTNDKKVVEQKKTLEAKNSD